MLLGSPEPAIQHQLASMRTVRPLRPCTKGYLPSNEVELLGGSRQLVPELRMSEADQRMGALGRGQALEVCGSELGDDVVRVDARSRDRPFEPRHDARNLAGGDGGSG